MTMHYDEDAAYDDWRDRHEDEWEASMQASKKFGGMWRAWLDARIAARSRRLHPSPEARAELRRMIAEGKVLQRVYKRRLLDRPAVQFALYCLAFWLVFGFWCVAYWWPK